MKTTISFLLIVVLAFGIAGVALGATGKPAAPHKPATVAKKPAAPRGFQSELRVLGIRCPTASVELQGSFGGAADGFMAVVVSKATGKASPLVGKQVALRLLKSTKILRNGPTTASKLKAGDRLSVIALMCSQGLVARNVTATAHKA